MKSMEAGVGGGKANGRVMRFAIGAPLRKATVGAIR
jgi:hypothetical protein